MRLLVLHTLTFGFTSTYSISRSICRVLQCILTQHLHLFREVVVDNINCSLENAKAVPAGLLTHGLRDTAATSSQPAIKQMSNRHRQLGLFVSKINKA